MGICTWREREGKLWAKTRNWYFYVSMFSPNCWGKRQRHNLPFCSQPCGHFPESVLRGKSYWLPQLLGIFADDSQMNLPLAVVLDQRKLSRPRLCSLPGQPTSNNGVKGKGQGLVPCLNTSHIWMPLPASKIPTGWVEASVATASQLNFCPCPLLLPLLHYKCSCWEHPSITLMGRSPY